MKNRKQIFRILDLALIALLFSCVGCVLMIASNGNTVNQLDPKTSRRSAETGIGVTATVEGGIGNKEELDTLSKKIEPDTLSY